MPLVTTEHMLLDAQHNGYAIGAFNVENMEMVKAVLHAAEEMKAPVILQTTPSTVAYGSAATFAAMVKSEAEAVSIPASLHLDHGSSVELAKEALRAGYTSIMIDGSQQSFADNIALTNQVLELASNYRVPVEAELGQIGGKEDGTSAEGDIYTDPHMAQEFLEKAAVGSLAVAIGTAHGFYQGKPVLDKVRLSKIRNLVTVPLVLHGASGVSDEEIRDCIQRGICKVNFATELRVAYTKAIRQLLASDSQVYDPKKLGKAGIQAVEALVKHKINICRNQ